MSRKDEILASILEHEMLGEKYKLTADDLPKTMKTALNSSVPIVKAIALIIDNLENSTPITDAALRNLITQYLNETAI